MLRGIHSSSSFPIPENEAWNGLGGSDGEDDGDDYGVGLCLDLDDDDSDGRGVGAATGFQQALELRQQQQRRPSHSSSSSSSSSLALSQEALLGRVTNVGDDDDANNRAGEKEGGDGDDADADSTPALTRVPFSSLQFRRPPSGTCLPRLRSGGSKDGGSKDGGAKYRLGARRRGSGAALLNLGIGSQQSVLDFAGLGSGGGGSRQGGSRRPSIGPGGSQLQSIDPVDDADGDGDEIDPPGKATLGGAPPAASRTNGGAPAPTGTASNGSGAAGAKSAPSTFPDLLADAQHHLSIVCLANLYELLRDMSERGYTRIAFDQVDVNLPRRPTPLPPSIAAPTPPALTKTHDNSRQGGSGGGGEGGKKPPSASLALGSYSQSNTSASHLSLCSVQSDISDRSSYSYELAARRTNYDGVGAALLTGTTASACGGVVYRYLDNTRTAGSVIRHLLEEIDNPLMDGNSGSPVGIRGGRGAAEGEGEGGESSSKASLGQSSRGGGGSELRRELEAEEGCERDVSIMEEFRAWVRESRVDGKGTNKTGAAGRRRDDDVPFPSYFKPKSVLALMMDQGVEIVHFCAGGSNGVGVGSGGGSGVPDEASYCLCVDRAAGAITIVFLGSITARSCMARSMAAYPNPLCGEKSRQQSDDDDEADDIHLHEGFASSLLRRRKDTGRNKLDEIFDRIDAAAKELARPDGGSYLLSVAGHGLGGALATIFSLYAAAEERFAGGQRPVSVFTFGAPRVGDVAFRSTYQRLERDGRLRHARFVDKRDVVPLLLTFSTVEQGGAGSTLGVIGRLYKHVGLKVRLHGPTTWASGGGTRNNIDAQYPQETDWLGKLKRAYSDNLLNNMPSTLGGLGRNHSLSEHQRRLASLRQQKRTGTKSLEEYYQIRAGLVAAEPKTSTPTLERARCTHFLLSILLTMSVAAIWLLYQLSAKGDFGLALPSSTETVKQAQHTRDDVGSRSLVGKTDIVHVRTRNDSFQLTNEMIDITRVRLVHECGEAALESPDLTGNDASASLDHFGFDQANTELPSEAAAGPAEAAGGVPVNVRAPFLWRKVQSTPSAASPLWGVSPHRRPSRQNLGDPPIASAVKRRTEFWVLTLEWEALQDVAKKCLQCKMRGT